jgi:uncharacterized membrane protein YkvA (DUF1232 family)
LLSSLPSSEPLSSSPSMPDVWMLVGAGECDHAAAWARTRIYGALAYFVLPFDAVPDFLPGAGYADDLGVLAFALFTVASYVDADVRRRTADVLSRLFAGSATPSTWQ